MLRFVMRLIFKTSSVTHDFFKVFNLILSFSTCSQSFKKICTWELLGANVLKLPLERIACRGPDIKRSRINKIFFSFLTVYIHFLRLLTNLERPIQKRTTHLSKRVRYVVPRVVVWPCLTGWYFT